MYSPPNQTVHPILFSFKIIQFFFSQLSSSSSFQSSNTSDSKWKFWIRVRVRQLSQQFYKLYIFSCQPSDWNCKKRNIYSVESRQVLRWSVWVWALNCAKLYSMFCKIYFETSDQVVRGAVWVWARLNLKLLNDRLLILRRAPREPAESSLDPIWQLFLQRHIASHHITAHHGTSHHITSLQNPVHMIHITSHHIASRHIT